MRRITHIDEARRLRQGDKDCARCPSPTCRDGDVLLAVNTPLGEPQYERLACPDCRGEGFVEVRA